MRKAFLFLVLLSAITYADFPRYVDYIVRSVKQFRNDSLISTDTLYLQATKELSPTPFSSEVPYVRSVSRSLKTTNEIFWIDSLIPYATAQDISGVQYDSLEIDSVISDLGEGGEIVWIDSLEAKIFSKPFFQSFVIPVYEIMPYSEGGDAEITLEVISYDSSWTREYFISRTYSEELFNPFIWRELGTMPEVVADAVREKKVYIRARTTS